MHLKKTFSSLLLSTLLVSTTMTAVTFADDMDMPPAGPPKHQGPPPEFFEACKGKAAGDSVTLETPHGDTIKAVCEQKDDQLIARPLNPPPPPKDGHEPPEQR